MKAPIAAWTVAVAVLLSTAALTGHAPFAPSTWERWDSAHYLSIAAHGYDMHRCAPGEIDAGGGWCGNAGWFPGYPWLIAAVHVVGIPAEAAALAIAWLFALLALVLVWRFFLRDLPAVAGTIGLAFAAFTPGQLYLFAVYPLSMLATFIVVFLAALQRQRWLVAGTAVFAAALTYPVGVVVLPLVALIWAAVSRSRAAAVTALPAALALATVSAVQRVQTGHWTAYLDVQGHYAHGLVHDPFGVGWNLMLILLRSSDPFSHSLAAEWQTLVASVVVAAVVVHAAFRRQRADLLFVVYAVIAWVFPLTQANLSIWRSHAALLPIAPLVAKLPRPVALVLVTACVVVAVAAARLYLEGRLI